MFVDREFVKSHRQHNIRHPTSASKLPSSQFHALLDRGDGAAAQGGAGTGGDKAHVSFPCALVASDPSFHLEEHSTLFFVLRPAFLSPDLDVSEHALSLSALSVLH